MELNRSEQQDKMAALEEQLLERDRLLRARERRIKKLEAELQAVAESKVWRLAEFFRRLFRVHLLGSFPALQLFILPTLKRWFRSYITLPLIRRGFIQGEYERWLEQEGLILEERSAVAREMAGFIRRPLISLIMPVYNVKPAWFKLAVASVQNQSYDHWQLCIADDCSTDQELKELLQETADRDERIRLRFLEKNQGIAGASNTALQLATGEFVGLLDNDDELAAEALFEVVKAINHDPAVDCLYSDEDKISEQGKRYDPFFKPDWSPDTLRSYNYLCHFTVIRRQLVELAGGFRAGFDGSQDYDLFLRVTERAKQIVHIPKILYHWRAIEGSVGKRGDAKMYAYTSAKKALTDHLHRIGLQAGVEDGAFLGSYRIRYAVDRDPEIAVIIPTKDKIDVLNRCVTSIRNRSTYLNYRIVLVDNGSIEEQTFAYYESLKGDERISLLHYDQPFNFSAINNFAVNRIDAEYLLFLNNDTEVISPDWLEEMLGHAQRPEVGAVGSLLYYSNNTVQHGGIIIGIGGVAGHSHKYFPRRDLGYFGRLKVVQNLSAVTAACLLTKRGVFELVGGFEEKLSHAFNDVDLCLKIRDQGHLVVYTPFAELYHHESISRGYENTKDKRERFRQEREFCEQRWEELLEAGDPYYSPHLTLQREDFSLG